MNLNEALAVYLYLKASPETAAWERKAFEDAWQVIYTEANAVLVRRLDEH